MTAWKMSRCLYEGFPPAPSPFLDFIYLYLPMVQVVEASHRRGD